MKYKIAIFDMDGTILNTLDDLADSMNHCLPGSRARGAFFAGDTHISGERDTQAGRMLGAGWTDAETLEKVLSGFFDIL